MKKIIKCLFSDHNIIKLDIEKKELENPKYIEIEQSISN